MVTGLESNQSWDNFPTDKFLLFNIVLDMFLNFACFAANPTIISESVKATFAGVVLSPVGLATTAVLPSLDKARHALVLPICIPKHVISLK